MTKTKKKTAQKTTEKDKGILYYDQDKTGSVVFTSTFKEYFEAPKCRGHVTLKAPKGHEAAVLLLGHFDKKKPMPTREDYEKRMAYMGYIALSDLESILPKTSLKKIQKLYKEKYDYTYNPEALK